MTIDTEDRVRLVGGVRVVLQAIPDYMQNELIQMGENWGRDKWSLGDFANVMRNLVRENALNASTADVYAAIALLVKEEVSARTVEYYAMISAFFDGDVRTEFGMLPHAHFAFARQQGENWLAVLEKSVDYMSQYGRPPSVDWLRRTMTPAETPDEPDSAWDTPSPEEGPADDETDDVALAASAAIGSLRRAWEKISLRFPQAPVLNQIKTLVDELEGFC